MRSFHRSLALLALTSVAACNVPANGPEGGSNGNDRSNGGEQGEALSTGAMVVSPDGRFALMQRNQTSVLFDIEDRSAHELTVQIGRFVFSKSGAFAVAVLGDQKTVVAYDLPAMTERWRADVAFAGAGANLVRLSDDDATLILGDAHRFFVIDARTGKSRGETAMTTNPQELSFVTSTQHALLVGETRWADGGPLTEVIDLDIATLDTKRIDVPNCSAPIAVLPDASRAFLSPTFCERDKTNTYETTWTNPDPVSVIHLGADGLRFEKNLPGFGPVAMDAAGTRVVAYLDKKRMDPTMFDDASKIPGPGAARYEIMTIDPKSLVIDLTPIGEVLPRFVLGKNGRTLLVDATVQQFRGEATVEATVDASGKVTAKIEMFAKTDSLFGAFDLDTRTYTPFAGPPATLDRFVQLGDAARVFTLKETADGRGGDIYRIDLASGASTSLGKSYRDIGLLPDGRTMLLRERLPAVQVQANGTSTWYRHEQYCLSLDGVTYLSCVEFQDSAPFQSGPTCSSYHDC